MDAFLLGFSGLVIGYVAGCAPLWLPKLDRVLFLMRRARARFARRQWRLTLSSLAAYDAARMIRANQGRLWGAATDGGSMSWAPSVSAATVSPDGFREPSPDSDRVVSICFERIYGDLVPECGHVRKCPGDVGEMLPPEDVRTIGQAMMDRYLVSYQAGARVSEAMQEEEHRRARSALREMLKDAAGTL